MDKIIATPNKTKEILKENKIILTKKLGQNFLIDNNIIKKIISAAELKEDDYIIEIGPGIGSLTEGIINELKMGKLFAIEKDRRLIKVLKKHFTVKDKIEIINEDVLKINWQEFFLKRGLNTRKIKVIANLPYYITTPIIMNLLESEVEFSKLIFMVQKEVAERIVAKPGRKDYGALSIAVQYYSEAEIISEIPPTVFIPQPKVWSAIVSLKPYLIPLVKVNNKLFFFKIVQAIFQQRRKNIKNALANSSLLKTKKELILNALTELEIDQQVRGERLSIEQIAELSNYLWIKLLNSQ